MSEVLTAAEFQALHRAVEKRSSQGAHNPQIVGSNPTGATKGPRSRITYSAPISPGVGTSPSKLTLVKDPQSEVSLIAHHLRAMGHWFNLDEKKVKFYIRQLELSKKI